MQKLFDYISKEWAVLRQAPGSFIGLAVVCLIVGFGAGLMYYSEQIETVKGRLEAANGQIGRYRVALGIDKASEGALVELNSKELALKAERIVAQMRELSRNYESRLEQLRKAQASEKSKKKDDLFAEQMRVMTEVSRDFDENLASDALNVENELHKRLTPEALSHVVRVPALIEIRPDGTRAPEGGRVTFLGLMRGMPMGAMLISLLANEIEQMAKLLPPDKQ